MSRVAVLCLVAAVACGAGPSSGTVEGSITEVSEDTVSVRPESGGSPERFVNGSDVPLEHLVEHMEQDWPVIVRWERRDGDRVAVHIDDA